MQNLAYGWLPDETVLRALEHLRESIGPTWVCVVRSIDSTRSRDDLEKWLSFLGLPYDVIRGNVCIRMIALWELVAKELLNGFDELWLFADNPPPHDLSRVQIATSEHTNFSQNMPADLVEAVRTSGCVLLLGDGCGLNYAAANDQLAEEITRVGS